MQTPGITSSVLTVTVKPDQMAAYEKWLKGIKSILEQQEGFLGIDVLRPPNQANPAYYLLIRFTRKDLLDRWRNSKQFATLRKQSEVFITKVERGEQQFGTEMFFDRPVSNIYYPKPPYWKQAVLGICTVYPVILTANILLRPLIQDLPPLLGLFFMVCIVSPSLIFLMPRVSQLFKFWLYTQNTP